MNNPLKKIKFILFVFGLVLIANSSLIKITGYAVNESFRVGGSVLGLVFIVFGIVLFLAEKEGGLEKTLAQQILESRRFDPKTKFLKKVARKSGYYFGVEVKEGTPVYDIKKNYITVIPHRKEVSIGVYWSIIKALATGESSFRQNYKSYG